MTRMHDSPIAVAMIVALACGTETPATQETGTGNGPTTDDLPSTGVVDTSTAGSATEATSGVMTTTMSGPDLDSSSGDGPKFDVGGIDDMDNGGCIGHETDATLTGTVYGPDGELPVSGALVYVTPDMPAGIPQQVYCAACTELGCDADETLSNADGSFSLPAASGQDKYLVVQKGQFLRITPLDIAPGPAAINDAITTLPSANDPDNGEYIPLIAVGDGSYDRLEDALGKFGMGDTVIQNFEERLVPGTETFALWDNGQDPGLDGFASQGTFDELISDPTALDDYHIIFVPCSTDDYTDALGNPQNVQNIRDWVAAGGRWYVSDWSNEWLQLVFPEYQDLASWDGSVGSADNGPYDSLADVNDDDLLAWLEALPAQFGDINPLNDEPHPTLGQLPQVMTVDNWSGITQTLQVMADDGKGGMVDVSHKVWLEGPGGDPAAIHPLTVTGQFGCGKLQFTSYHTAEFFDYVGLSPQELVLLYTILEIGSCQEPLPPPEG